MTAGMLISLRKQQNVNFTQRISSKMSIDFTLTRDGEDVDFTYKTAKC